jgi:hypothetical protein
MWVFMVVVLLCSSVAFGGSTQECCMQVDEAAEMFINDIFRTSCMHDPELPPEERYQRYHQAIAKLLAVAREWRVETQLLNSTLKEYVEFTEANRKPPPGWDWNDRVADLIRYSEHAKVQVRLDLELISYARRYCWRRGEVE